MSDFKIGPIPHTRGHLFADVVELLLCFDGRSEISKSDLENLLTHGLTDVDEEPNPLNETDPPAGISSAEQQERKFLYIEDCFTHLAFRRKAFGACYPFQFRKGVVIRTAKLTKKHYLYLALLVCSRLACFKKKQQKLSSFFEEVSQEALKALLPPFADVRIFGANSLDRKTYYGSNLRDAIRKLGSDLREGIDEENVEQEAASGDKGLDIVGHIRFHDPARGSIAYLGQCAARSTDWPAKTFEAHPDRWAAFFRFVHKPTNIVFIPVCYRQANGEWVQNSSCYGAVLLDRLRICHLLQRKKLRIDPINLFKTNKIALA